MSTRNFKILCDLAFWSNYIGKNDKILEPKDMIKEREVVKGGYMMTLKKCAKSLPSLPLYN
jgi:hypothetical protein